MAADERQSVIDRLTKYRDRMTAIMELIGDKRSLNASERARIQSLYESLKTDLKADHKEGSTARGEAELTQTELAYFQPAVTQAMVELRAATNTNPITSKWHSLLYAARMDIESFLNQLT